MVKHSPASAGDTGPIPGPGRSPGEGNGNPLQYSCLEDPMEGESLGERSLVSYSPWGRKELDTTERLHLIVLCRRETNEFSNDAWLTLKYFQKLYSVVIQGEPEESIIKIVSFLYSPVLECV